jgi:hypothetical protein
MDSLLRKYLNFKIGYSAPHRKPHFLEPTLGVHFKNEVYLILH